MGAWSRSARISSRRVSSRPVVSTAVVLSLALGLGLAGCGGSSKSTSSQTIIAGQLGSGQADIKLPPGWKMTKNGPVRTVAAPGAAAPGATTATGDTVPLAKEDPTTKFFGALGIFQSCLKGLGTKFIGIPSASNPNSPANNPDYIKALSTCAAKSNIVKALQDQQAAQDALTPAQIETQNKGLPRVARLHDRPRLGHPQAEARREGSPLRIRRGWWEFGTELHAAARARTSCRAVMCSSARPNRSKKSLRTLAGNR